MIVGLTGGIASGKTLCCNWFAAQGCYIIDADLIAKELVTVGGVVWLQLRAHFGETIFYVDGNLNRALLREKMFHNQEIKEKVNQIFHPAVRAEIEKRIHLYPHAFTLLDVPLLFETQLHKICHMVIVVDIPVSLQIARGVCRDGVNSAQMQRIIASQISREKRLSLANFIIDNSNSIAQTYQQCQQIYQQILSLNAA